MSLSEKHTVKCIKCGNNFEIKEWNSINIDELPDLRSQVMNGDIFKFKCENCGETHAIIYNCLYYDKTGKFMIQLLPGFEANEYIFSQEEESYIKTFGDNIYRLTTDYISFLEKLRVLTEGFNDKAIEICKTVAFTSYTLEHPDETPENAFYVRMENDKLVFQLMINEEKAEFVKLPISFYQKVESKLNFHKLNKERLSMQKIDINWALNEKVASFLNEIK